MKIILLRVILPVLILSIALSVHAQSRVSFESLSATNREPGVYFDFVYQPTSDGQTEVTIVYRIRHTFLTFRRQLIQSADAPQTQFTSDVEITFDFYPEDTPPVPDRPFLKRENWQRSVTVLEYAETQDAARFLTGMVSFQLPADRYRMIPTMLVNGRQVAGIRVGPTPAGPSQPRLSRRQAREQAEAEKRRGILEIPDLTTNTRFELTLLEGTADDSQPVLMNMGRNVRYAQHYALLVSAPTTAMADSITLNLYDLGTNPSAESPSNTALWTKRIDSSDLWGSGHLNFTQSATDTQISLTTPSEAARTYYRVPVPNERFPNVWYQAQVLLWKDGESSVVGTHRYLSLWQNIPTSLLNLDVAIDMMRFLLDRDQLREMRRGSATEREARFRAFWLERDPTPGTDFNELMAEYYRRIDFAYRTYTTPSKSGIDADQGRIYIVYGPPDQTERLLPPGGTPTEIWTYGARTFVFRATSGFGDFQLIEPN